MIKTKFVWYRGKKYKIVTKPVYKILVTDAPTYKSFAMDEEGNRAIVYWSIRQEYDGEEQGESEACDWDKPDIVIKF